MEDRFGPPIHLLPLHVRCAKSSPLAPMQRKVRIAIVLRNDPCHRAAVRRIATLKVSLPTPQFRSERRGSTSERTTNKLAYA
jgi:hypothetical protein